MMLNMLEWPHILLPAKRCLPINYCQNGKFNFGSVTAKYEDPCDWNND